MRKKIFKYKEYGLKPMHFRPCGRKKIAGIAFTGNFFAVANFATAKKLQIGVVRIKSGRCILIKKTWVPLTIAKAKKLIEGDTREFEAYGVADYFILDSFCDNYAEYTYAAIMYFNT